MFRRSAKPVAQQQSFQASHGLSHGLTLHRSRRTENLWKLTIPVDYLLWKKNLCDYFERWCLPIAPEPAYVCSTQTISVYLLVTPRKRFLQTPTISKTQRTGRSIALFGWLEKRLMLMLIYWERKTLLFRWNGMTGKFKLTGPILPIGGNWSEPCRCSQLLLQLTSMFSSRTLWFSSYFICRQHALSLRLQTGITCQYKQSRNLMHARIGNVTSTSSPLVRLKQGWDWYGWSPGGPPLPSHSIKKK